MKVNQTSQSDESQSYVNEEGVSNSNSINTSTTNRNKLQMISNSKYTLSYKQSLGKQLIENNFILINDHKGSTYALLPLQFIHFPYTEIAHTTENQKITKFPLVMVEVDGNRDVFNPVGPSWLMYSTQ
eukprot:GHVR01108472.1.p1 GENE.GHVR01108472.1~~GHVR01108472.1.p1  ORF type:complete len:128 (+),score=17.50 GHVR01108472.1:92-475(+)